MSKQWIQAVKAHDLVILASTLLNMRSGRMRTLGPCPACSADRRGSSDGRLPIGVKSGGWQCHACGAQGDVVEMLAHSVLGKTSKGLHADGWDRLRSWCAENALLDNLSEVDDAPIKRTRPARTKSVADILRKKPQKRAGGAAASGGTEERPKGRQPSRGPFKWREGLFEECSQALWADTPEAAQVREYLLGYRKLSEEAVRAFSLGLFVIDGKPHTSKAGRPYLTIPLAGADERVVNVRFRSVPVVGTCEHCETPRGCSKCREYRVCEGRPLPLFGSQNLGNDLAGPVLITEGELDVVALYSYGFTVSVVSGTAGAGAGWDKQDDWLDLLEPYESIVGVYDDDDAGSKGWAKLVELLGPYRCSNATLPKKDAGDCLIEGVGKERVARALGRAKSALGIEFRSVDSYDEQIENLIENPIMMRGVSSGSDKLDECLGGVRLGELWVATGETGEGKTSVFTWFMLEQAKRGFAGAITSFEQQPIGTVQKLLRIEVGGDFTQCSREDRLAAMQRLGKYPLRILDHYGDISPTKLVESIRYAKRRHGTTRFLIDHLGYCVDQDSEDEKRAIDVVVKALAQLAVNEGILIILIAHPHNISMARGWQRVRARNLKGSSTIRQEAHVIVVVVKEDPNVSTKGARIKKVKRPWPQSRFFFDKIRSEFGLNGSECALAFDPLSTGLADDWDSLPCARAGLLVPRRRAPASAQEEDD